MLNKILNIGYALVTWLAALVSMVFAVLGLKKLVWCAMQLFNGYTHKFELYFGEELLDAKYWFDKDLFVNALTNGLTLVMAAVLIVLLSVVVNKKFNK